VSTDRKLTEELAKKYSFNVHMATSYREFCAAINEAIERCAVVCDDRANAVAGDEPGDQLCEDTADILAARIRALKS
jgi:hypothetical protein